MTTIFEEETKDGICKYILIDPKLIKNKDKNLIKNEVLENNFVKFYLPSLPEYKWSVNKDIIKKEIMFNQYFIS